MKTARSLLLGVLFLLVSVVSLHAQTRTTVTDTIRTGAGALASGALYITPSQQFTTSGGIVVAPITTTVAVTNGRFTTMLYPNDSTSSPPSSGCPSVCTHYQVRYSLNGEAQQITETWLVPTAASPVNLLAVRQSPTPLPSPTVALSQVTSGGGVPGQCPVLSAGLIWVPGSCGSGGGGGGGAPTDAQYITRRSEAGLSAEFSLGALANGILKQTVAAGVSTPSIALAGTDYVIPGGSITGNSGTASALDHDPSPCPAGQPVTDVSASITLTCTTLTAAQITNAFDKTASNTVTTGTQNFAAADHTIPAKVVASVGALPSTGCTPGELAMVTAATLGQQIYENSGSGTCVWTQQTGGGGGGGGTLSTINSDSTPAQTLTRTNDTNITVTIVDNGAGDHKFNLSWAGTLSAARLNSNVVQAVTNDTNVTGVIAAQVLTLGWTGSLSKARQNPGTVYTDQANTYSAFLQDFGLASLKTPNSAGAACATTALLCYDSTAHLFKGGVNGTNRTFGVLKGTYSGGDFLRFDATDGLLAVANFNQNADGSLNASKTINAPAPYIPTYNAGGTTTCDWSQSNVCSFTTGAGNTTLGLTNAHGSGPYTLKVLQGTPARTVTYPGTAVGFCTISPTAAKTTTITFAYDGTNYFEKSCVSDDPIDSPMTGPASSIAGDVMAFADTSGKVSSDSGFLAANVVRATSPGAGLLHFAGGTQNGTSSAVIPADMDVSADNTIANATTGHHGLVPKGSGSATDCYLGTSVFGACPSGGGGGGGGSVFTGSTATASTGITGTATNPSFSLADQSVKSPKCFEPAQLAASVASVTFTNKTAGAEFCIAWLQGTAGSWTVTYGASASNTCAISATASKTTTQFFRVKADGTTVLGTLCTSDDPADLVIGGGGSVFTGSTAVAPAFSTTPTFSLADISVKSPKCFEPGQMTASVTSVTFTNKTAGAEFCIAWYQGTAGGWTVSYGASATNTCTISATASRTTTQYFRVKADGSTVIGAACFSDDPADLVVGGGGSGTSFSPVAAQFEYQHIFGPVSTAINFGSTATGLCGVSTLTFYGAKPDDAVAVKRPATLPDGWQVTAWVSDYDLVKIQACNLSGTTTDPASLSYGVSLIR